VAAGTLSSASVDSALTAQSAPLARQLQLVLGNVEYEHSDAREQSSAPR
jgi:hypothetical protein